MRKFIMIASASLLLLGVARLFLTPEPAAEDEWRISQRKSEAAAAAAYATLAGELTPTPPVPEPKPAPSPDGAIRASLPSLVGTAREIGAAKAMPAEIVRPVAALKMPPETAEESGPIDQGWTPPAPETEPESPQVEPTPERRSSSCAGGNCQPPRFRLFRRR